MWRFKDAEEHLSQNGPEGSQIVCCCSCTVNQRTGVAYRLTVQLRPPNGIIQLEFSKDLALFEQAKAPKTAYKTRIIFVCSFGPENARAKTQTNKNSPRRGGVTNGTLGRISAKVEFQSM